jgi:Glycoside hydrolase 123, catalytic domain/Glycoside hydrolase 123 N-terminal domain
MRRLGVFTLLVFCVCLPGTARGAAPEGASAWFVDSLIKIFPTDAAGKHGLANPELLAARGQHVSVQLAIRSAHPLDGLTAELAPLTGSKGETLDTVTVHPVGYVVVGSHSQDTPEDEVIGEAPGWYPDPLLDFPVNVPAKRTQPLWVSVAVPDDAAPGIYRGVLVVRAGERTLARRALRVKVVEAVVPAARTLKMTNWFTVGDKASKQFYGIDQFSPEWWTLVANIGRVMAAHRQNMVITPVMDLVTPRAEGDKLVYDFANFDRWVETFKQAGVVGYIEGGHLLDRAGSYDAGLIVHTFQLENGQVVKQTLPPDDPRVESFEIGFLSALNAHLDEKGWKPIYYQHILDEAHGKEPPYYARFAELVHRYLPGVPTMDAVDAEHMPDELQKYCDVWVPQLGRFDDQMQMIDRRMASGREVWYYVCLFPNRRYLNRLMDYPLLKARLLPWLDFRYGFTGFLHWGWNYWTPEPMLDTQPVIDANTQLLPSGDAFIVYPDKARLSVRSSIRLETMLQGTEDYEMLMALKAKNPEAAANLGEEAIAGFTDYVRSVEKFRSIERQLLEALGQ